MICEEHPPWLRRFLPFRERIAPARTPRRVLRSLDPAALERAFSIQVASRQEKVSSVVVIDGKALRGSKQDKSGAGALHRVSAYARASGLMLANRAVVDKSNKITAIPELLDILEIEGAIVTTCLRRSKAPASRGRVDAIGTQKATAAKIIDAKADSLSGAQGEPGNAARGCRRVLRRSAAGRRLPA